MTSLPAEHPPCTFKRDGSLPQFVPYRAMLSGILPSESFPRKHRRTHRFLDPSKATSEAAQRAPFPLAFLTLSTSPIFFSLSDFLPPEEVRGPKTPHLRKLVIPPLSSRDLPLLFLCSLFFHYIFFSIPCWSLLFPRPAVDECD